MAKGPDIAAGRLSKPVIARNFADIAPRFEPNEARVAAERCLFCYDAPCVKACDIDQHPLFIARSP
jgi:glutamate synthase (NADPH/NADH) small chain